ncbi:hypothetical protein LCGC14_3021920, partial [marine sediment metagenome]
NGSGDAKVQVKEAIDTMPTSGILEIHGDEYAYTSLDTANKAFNLSGTLSQDYAEDDADYIQTTIRNATISGNAAITGNATVTGDLIAAQGIDKIKDGTDFGRNVIFDGNAALPAAAYNGTGDGIVRVKESIDNLSTSGVLEIAGDEYAYTSVTIADKEFNLSGTLSKDYSEDDAVYVQTTIRNLAISGNTTIATATRYISPSLVGYGSAASVVFEGTRVVFGANSNAYIAIALPEGAIITRLDVWITSSDGVITTTIWRRDLGSTAASDNMAQVTDEGNDTSINEATVDNANYKYFVKVMRSSHGTTAYLDGIKITYTVMKPLP